MSDKDLFKKALGYYICNVDDVIDEIYDEQNWCNAVIWEPFDGWEVNDLHDLVTELQNDFITLNKTR